MSTRCHVVVRNGKDENKEKWNYIYHHCDGYPSGVGKELNEILTEIHDNGISRNDFNANFITEKIWNYSDEYECDNSIHGDEEYIYLIDVEHKYTIGNDSESNSITLTCYRVLSFAFDTDPEDFSAEEGYKRYSTNVMYFDLYDEEKDDDECEQEGHVEGYFNMHNLDALDDNTFLKLFYRVTQEYADRFDEETFSVS